jgi:serine/threonine protein kinase
MAERPPGSPSDPRGDSGARKPAVAAGVPSPAEVSTLAAANPATPAGSFPAEPRSLAGFEFDDFVLLEEVGRGGMGVVYKAWQRSLDRLVAVKMLLAEHFCRPELLVRFLAEARAAAGLSHPNIVNIYQVGQCIAGHYFAMEYIDGQTLEGLAQDDGRRRPMLPLWAVSVLIPVAQAVHFAHKHGIIHRDLKPANIMIDAHKRPVVMDFGIAKGVSNATGLTLQGAIIGTPAFMSPEQAGEKGAQVGPPSDVYSLGAILYTLLTGRLAYEAETPLRTILQVISADLPPPVRALRPEVPPSLEELVMKCLSKDPSRRYPSAKALAVALSQEVLQLRTPPPAPKPAAAPAAPPAATAGRRALTGTKTPTPGGARRSGPHPTPVPPSAPAPAPLPVVTLVVLQSGKEIRLSKPVTTVGRASSCEVVLKASEVSKQHCRLLLKPKAVVVEDLGSANGTFVNGEPVERSVLHDGDCLQIADHEFLVRVEKSAS